MKQKNEELKLYVFEEFCPDYTDGLAFAIAESEGEAKILIWQEGLGFGKVTPESRVDDLKWGKIHIYSLSEKIAFAVMGGS